MYGLLINHRLDAGDRARLPRFRQAARGLAAGALMLLMSGAVLPESRATEQTAEQAQELDQQVGELINQLGSPEFARRERAQAALERLGLVAFDALRDAQQHEDIEIALRAKYLVRRLQVRWYDEQDSAEVRRVLRDYGQQSESERRSRMERLSALEDGQGLLALCRLVRFESELRLAKHAALLIMNSPLPVDAEPRSELGQRLLEGISLSKNPAAVWVKTFAESLTRSQPGQLPWDEIIADEKETLAHFPERTSPEIVVELLRWRAEQLFAADQRAAAEPLVKDSLELLSAKREQVLAAVDWLLEHELWPMVDDVAARFPQLVQDSLLLQYRVAEAQRRGGDAARAEATAAAALASKAEQFEEHVEAAARLQERGQFDWAEREYRYVIESAGPASLHETRARFFLAEMLHDQLQELAAAEALKDVVERMQQDQDYAKRVKMLRSEPEEIPARMHFFYAEHYANIDRAKQKEHLEKGIASFPREIDLLIAMHQFPDADEAWRQRVSKMIADTAGFYRERIRQYSDTLQQTIGQPIEDDLRVYIARLNNQLAWLIANTEGDFDEALRCSRLSLEYMPDAAGYLDTLGRCYYAKEDYANAVKYQSRAAELDPHSGQIRRQLELFQQALAESGSPDAAR